MSRQRQGHDAPLVLRAHHMLCIGGFRGLGYSKAFVATMRRVSRTLRRESTLVQVTLAPDVICRSCPHLHSRPLCSSAEGTRRDRATMRALGVAPGEIRPWGDWLGRLGAGISPDALGVVCEGCEWLPLGHCVEGIRLLTAEREEEGRS